VEASILTLVLLSALAIRGNANKARWMMSPFFSSADCCPIRNACIAATARRMQMCARRSRYCCRHPHVRPCATLNRCQSVTQVHRRQQWWRNRCRDNARRSLWAFDEDGQRRNEHVYQMHRVTDMSPRYELDELKFVDRSSIIKVVHDAQATPPLFPTAHNSYPFPSSPIRLVYRALRGCLEADVTLSG
jgi:hypothetical protein